MKTTFTQVTDYQNQPHVTITVETDAVCIAELVAEFRRFLLGCGFSPNNVTEYFGEE